MSRAQKVFGAAVLFSVACLILYAYSVWWYLVVSRGRGVDLCLVLAAACAFFGSRHAARLAGDAAGVQR